ncbi:hypothetical protein V0288_25160 [Pannus brasiliensis CCIBt3594]|uniref:Uncharacterized protein n=1 Tax=Pannus brasiliensis CCIBt3594 TaxID=1427578 RepID=A0AAW9QYK7_9CHRO
MLDFLKASPTDPVFAHRIVSRRPSGVNIEFFSGDARAKREACIPPVPDRSPDLHDTDDGRFRKIGTGYLLFSRKSDDLTLDFLKSQAIEIFTLR